VPFAQNRTLCSIFFGGGTPSLMSGVAVARILDAAEKYIGFADNIEITLEANPGTVERQHFHDYRKAGVNRLSLGAQSFDDAQLQKLGRIHRADETRHAVDALRAAGFDNFNLDLMFALPEQTTNAALADLQQALALHPTHLSWYQLTIEPNTVFFSTPPAALPDDDMQFEIYQTGKQWLQQTGYEQYETSAYSQPGRQCIHNRNYWEFGDYLGIGAGAHGKVTQIEKGKLQVRRRQKTRLPAHYLKSVNPCSQDTVLTPEDLPVEFMLNALRLMEGVPRELFAARTGLPLAGITQTVNQLIQDGLLKADTKQLVPTPRGALFLNDVVSRFMRQ